MPWRIANDAAGCDGWAVVQDSNGKVVGCHPTREKALDQLAVLNINVREASMDEITQFHGRIDNPVDALEQLDKGATVGEIEVVTAVFGVQDTGQPVGVKTRQVIDHGAFRTILDNRDFSSRPAPYYLDHGHAMVQPFVDQRLKLGKSDKYREEDSDFRFRGLVNLRKQVAREAFSDMLFDPANTPHSFRWGGHEKTYRGEDGIVHVSEFDDILEASLCGRAAQMATGVLEGTASMRAAIPAHSTETYTGEWDGSGTTARISDEAGASVLRREFAWVDPDGDPNAKGSYKFPHHTVEGGKVGGANVAACRAIVANLNGARSTASIPAGDRRGVYAHAARHLRDAGVEDIAPLRATIEEIKDWAGEDPEFAAAMQDAIGLSQVGRLESKETDGWFDSLVQGEMKTALMRELVMNSGARAELRQLVEEAEKADPAGIVLRMYDDIWSHRSA